MPRPNIDDPDLPLAIMFQTWPETAGVFLSHRMLCFGCPIAPFHTAIDACLEYRLDEAAFREELRLAIVGPGPAATEGQGETRHPPAGDRDRPS
jgi:hybrid cluster-associated redox disulfide protein